MKKLLALILAVCMLLSFCGCADRAKTITASNGDKITVSLDGGNAPYISVAINGTEIYSCDSFSKASDQYNFEEDFNLDVKQEFSDEKITWAYQFDWGTVYATPYEDDTIYVASAKHEYGKNCFGTPNFLHLAEQLDLVEFEISEYTGKKYFWDNYSMAQAIVEDIYKTTDYDLIKVSSLSEAGYDFEQYYDMYDIESGIGWGEMFEVYIEGEKTALLHSNAAEFALNIQEVDWEKSKKIDWQDENGYGVFYAVE